MGTKKFDSLFSSNEVKLKNQKIGKHYVLIYLELLKLGLERHIYAIMLSITVYFMQIVN